MVCCREILGFLLSVTEILCRRRIFVAIAFHLCVGCKYWAFYAEFRNLWPENAADREFSAELLENCKEVVMYIDNVLDVYTVIQWYL